MWNHEESEPTDPVELWYEIEKDQWAIRGFEIFFDGSICKLNSMGLSAQIPTLQELGEIKEFDGYKISAEDFEDMWIKDKECKPSF